MGNYQYRKQSFWRSKTRVMFEPEVWGQCRFCFQVMFNAKHHDALMAKWKSGELGYKPADADKPRLVIEENGLCTECCKFHE